MLIDTHVFLWLESEPERVEPSVRAIVEDTDNELYLSAASGWEIAIKHAIGKLSLPTAPSVYVQTRMARGAYHELPVAMIHALAVGSLPLHHSDPFDRLLIAQAQVEGLTLVTTDERIARYAVKVLRT